MQTDTLIQKLENFIKKYYQNQLLKGLILSFSLVGVVFFTLTFFEYLGRFGIQTRTTLFYLFIGIALFTLIWYIIRPILGLININRNFGIKEASRLIGNHFPEVKDKLINTLQLKEEASQQRNSLLSASIDQRTAELSPIPFSKAIPFQGNLKYVKYALLPALALLFILVVSPGFKKSSERVVNFNQHFEIEAPFNFITDLDNKKAIQNQNIEIPLNLEGNKIPRDAYIHIGSRRYKMKTKGIGVFNYTLTNIQKTEQIYFESGGFTSRQYELDIALKPSLIGYSAKVSYPSYLNISNKVIRNIGELSVPEGTTIEWKFNTKNVSELVINPDKKILKPKNSNISFSKRFRTSTLVNVNTKNSQVNEGDSVFYQINVVKDEFPQIAIEQKKDSLSNKVFYFLGDISDDHGFSKLQFNYRFKKSSVAENQEKSGKLPVTIDPSVTSQSFYHYWSLEPLNVQPEDELEYFFTVWDNDGVNGAKPNKTDVITYRAPSLEEIEEQTEEANKEIKNSIAGAQSDAADLEKEIKSVEQMLTEKKNLDWNDKKKIQDLLNKQKELEEKIRNSINKNLEKNQKENEFNPAEEQMLEKQKQLEELMDEVLDDETRKLMEKIEQLLEENKKNELQRALNEFKFSEKEMSKEMDRMLELFKELELEKKLNETINKLNELAKKQQELAEKTKKEKGKNEQLEKQQVKLKDEFNKAKKNMEDIQKKNKALESPMKLSEQKEKQESVDQKMDNASQKQQKGKNQDAGEQMEDAAEEMQDMADQLQQEIQDSQEEQQEEDYNNLRQILENLVQLSFDQESVLNGFKQNRKYSPKYVELRQRQRKIKDETKMVEDSLLALSKRNLEIKSFVNDEVARVNDNLDKSLVQLGERRTNNAVVYQQYAMTGYNNLALMLAESLKKTQEQMKQNKPSKGSCKNPGGQGQGKPQNGKPNPAAIKKMQKELADQMKQLQDGQKKGDGKPSSKDFAEMAAKQAAIRKKMQELDNALRKEGKGGTLGDLKKTQDMMDDLEEDLYNKRLNNQTFKKLNQIEIKLSEHERAQKEQEQDNKRSSNEGKEIDRPIPPSIQKYLEEKRKETELLRTVTPELQPYYQQKVKEYFGR